MQVSFIDYFMPEHVHYYDVDEVGDGWNWLDDTARIFPSLPIAAIAAAATAPARKACKCKRA